MTTWVFFCAPTLLVLSGCTPSPRYQTVGLLEALQQLEPLPTGTPPRPLVWHMVRLPSQRSEHIQPPFPLGVWGRGIAWQKLALMYWFPHFKFVVESTSSQPRSDFMTGESSAIGWVRGNRGEIKITASPGSRPPNDVSGIGGWMTTVLKKEMVIRSNEGEKSKHRWHSAKKKGKLHSRQLRTKPKEKLGKASTQPLKSINFGQICILFRKINTGTDSSFKLSTSNTVEVGTLDRDQGAMVHLIYIDIVILET
ncbi:hypothetical protein DFH06DRAFT_1130894 [Mycena polygramma]|nr:hypothetical protein DFH06DRAFT_1130894 [Mycena polygramma]